MKPTNQTLRNQPIVSAAQPTLGGRRFHPHPSRRGIVLVFVVVLLVLLAIMGTAYLATVRMDRLQVTGRGASGNPVGLFDATELERISGVVRTRILEDIARGVFAYPQGPNHTPATGDLSRFTYRNPEGASNHLGALVTTYGDNDPINTTGDRWLASLLPLHGSATPPFVVPTADNIYWPVISAPVARRDDSQLFPDPVTDSVFRDPRFSDDSMNYGISLAERRNLFIGSVDLVNTTGTPPDVRNRNRSYPGLSDGSRTFIAADADGDGIADAGLMAWPLTATPLNNTQANFNARYVADPRNPGVAYYVGIRVVDNSAQINTNTAFSVTGDYALNKVIGGVQQTSGVLAQDILDANPNQPNLGFWRSNVGLIELLRGLGNPNINARYNRTNTSIYPPNGTPDPFEADVAGLLAVRLNLGRNQELWRGSSDGTGDTLNFFNRRLSPPSDPNSGSYTYLSEYVWPDDPDSSDNRVIPIRHAGGPPPQMELGRLTLGDALESGIATDPSSPRIMRYTLDTTSNLLVPERRFGSFDDVPSTSISLATGGGLLNPNYINSELETAMRESLVFGAANFGGSVGNTFKFFPANEVLLWYQSSRRFERFNGTGPTAAYSNDRAQNFEPAAASSLETPNFFRSPRPLLTGFSAVTSYTRSVGRDSSRPDRLVDPISGAAEYSTGFSGGRIRTPNDPPEAPNPMQHPTVVANVNTASYHTLMRAFWIAMSDNNQGVVPVADPAFTGNQGRRVVAGAPPPAGDDDLTTFDMLVLRSAIAAANTVDMRPEDPTPIPGDSNSDVSVGGTSSVTTIYAKTDDTLANAVTSSPSLPISLEGSRPTPLSAWVFGYERQPFLVKAAVAFDPATPVGSPPPVTGVVVTLYNPYNVELDLHAAGFALGIVTRDATTGRVSSVTATYPFPVNSVIPADGTLTVSSTAPGYNLDWSQLTAAVGNELVLLRPRRPGGQVNYTDWTVPTGAVPVDLIDLRKVTQTQAQDEISALAAESPPVVPTSLLYRYDRAFGGANRFTAAYAGDFTGNLLQTTRLTANTIIRVITNGTAALPDDNQMKDSVDGDVTVPTVNIPLLVDVPDQAAFPSSRFPFGSPFSRDGDLLTIPFIGSYVIFQGNQVIDFQTITTDSARVDTTPDLDDQTDRSARIAAGAALTTTGRFLPETAGSGNAKTWSARVLDVLSVNQATVGKTIPNFDYPRPVASDPTQRVPPVWATSNVVGRPIQGRININTAPLAVLEMLPFVVDKATGQIDFDANRQVAQEIINAREVSPFRDVTDLLDPGRTQLAQFATMNGILTGSLDRLEQIRVGMLNPEPLGTGIPLNIPYRTSRFVQFNRLSNLITTRSDSFTVHITVQAWKNAGRRNARMISEKRQSFVVDRTDVLPTSVDLATIVNQLRVFDIE